MGLLKRITQPTTNLPSRLAKQVSDKISPSNAVGSPLRGFASGAIEGAGNLVSDMTSPLSLATSAVGLPWLRNAPKLIGLGNFARRIPTSNTSINAGNPFPEMVQGAEDLYNAGRKVPIKPKTVEDLAYEVVSNPNKIKSSIGRDYNTQSILNRAYSR